MKTGSQAVIWASNENFWQPSVESQSTHPFIKNIVHVAEFLISWKYFTNFREAGGSTENGKMLSHYTNTVYSQQCAKIYFYLAFFIIKEL